MAIKSREELEHPSVNASERSYEQSLFVEAIRDFPGLSQESKRMFWEDEELKGSYFSDLQDEDKQSLFEEKTGSNVLQHFSSNKAVHMLRNEAVHSLKTKGRRAPYSAMKGRPLEVSNPKAFTYDGGRVEQTVDNTAPTYSEELSRTSEALEARQIDPEAFGLRTHSLGDKETNTLYFDDREDILGLDAESSFEYDGVQMGSARQGLLYAQAKEMKDNRRALDLGAGPMDGQALRKNKLYVSPYNMPNQKDTLRDNLSNDLGNVLKARYDEDEKAREALLQTEGHRLVYASTDDTLGVGYDIDEIEGMQQSAVYDNREFVIKEKNRDSNNVIGRISADIRNNYLRPEPENTYDASSPRSISLPPVPESLQQSVESSSTGNPFGEYEGLDEVRSVRDMEERTVDFQSAVSEESVVSKKPASFAMSIHASDNLSERGTQRATHAVGLFAKEAEDKNQQAVVYVHDQAPTNLKKAVYAHKDRVAMQPLDKEQVPNRSLIVQNEQTLTHDFKNEVQWATQNSASRDVRALSVDPTEPEMYVLNDYLTSKTDKVQVSVQSDSVELQVAESAKEQASPSASDDARDIARWNEQRNQKARQEAKNVKTDNPSKGVYQENPF